MGDVPAMMLTWKDLDNAVAVIAAKVRHMPLTGVFGPPRGGVCLSVVLSHALGVPFFKEFMWPKMGMVLWVDDVIDSGYTIDKAIKRCPTAIFSCWVNKQPTTYTLVHSALTAEREQWVVFPWEDPYMARQSRIDYLVARATT